MPAVTMLFVRLCGLMHAPNSDTGRELLADWVYLAELAGLSEFKDCTKAVHNWSDEILASFDCGYTNGFTEDCNNKTKGFEACLFCCPQL